MQEFRERLTSIKDGHGGAAEELTASSAQLDLFTDMSVIALRSHVQTSSQGQPSENTGMSHSVPSLGHEDGSGVVRTLLPEKWWTEVLESMA